MASCVCEKGFQLNVSKGLIVESHFGNADGSYTEKWQLSTHITPYLLAKTRQETRLMLQWYSATHLELTLLRARPKAERVLAEYENFLKLSDRPTDRPTVTPFSVLYLLNQATD